MTPLIRQYIVLKNYSHASDSPFTSNINCEGTITFVAITFKKHNATNLQVYFGYIVGNIVRFIRWCLSINLSVLFFAGIHTASHN